MDQVRQDACRDFREEAVPTSISATSSASASYSSTTRATGSCSFAFTGTPVSLTQRASTICYVLHALLHV